MGLEDLAGKAQDMAGDLGAQAQGAVNAAKGALASEEKTDALLDKVADAANNLTGGKFADKIDAARDAADDKLGGQ